MCYKECNSMDYDQEIKILFSNPHMMLPFSPHGAGKHPVCVLQEVCAKKHWGVPSYKMVCCATPNHMMTGYLCRVSGVHVCVHAISNQPHTHVLFSHTNAYAGHYRSWDLPTLHLKSKQDTGKGPGRLSSLG